MIGADRNYQNIVTAGCATVIDFYSFWFIVFVTGININYIIRISRYDQCVTGHQYVNVIYHCWELHRLEDCLRVLQLPEFGRNDSYEVSVGEDTESDREVDEEVEEEVS